MCIFVGLLSRVSSGNRMPGSNWHSQESLQSCNSKLLQQFGSIRIADQVCRFIMNLIKI